MIKTRTHKAMIAVEESFAAWRRGSLFHADSHPDSGLAFQVRLTIVAD